MSGVAVTLIVIRNVLVDFFSGGVWDPRDVNTVIDKLTDPSDMSMDKIIDQGVIKDGRPRYFRQAPVQGVYTKGDGEAAVDKLVGDPGMNSRPSRGWFKLVLTRLYTRTYYKASAYDGIYIEARDIPIAFLQNAEPDGRSVLCLDLAEIVNCSRLRMPDMLREAQRERKTAAITE